MPGGGCKPSTLHIGKRSDPEYQKKYKDLNREKLNFNNKLYQREYYKKYPDRYIYWGAKGRSKELGLPFDITIDDVQSPEVCPILGIQLKRNTGGNRPNPESPSLDRIQPELGYVKGNVQVISHRANVMKSDASIEELRSFALWVLKTYPL